MGERRRRRREGRRKRSRQKDRWERRRKRRRKKRRRRQERREEKKRGGERTTGGGRKRRRSGDGSRLWTLVNGLPGRKKKRMTFLTYLHEGMVQIKKKPKQIKRIFSFKSHSHHHQPTKTASFKTKASMLTAAVNMQELLTGKPTNLNDGLN